MEQYLWMAIGWIIVGFFAKTYWDVYQAYRAYMNNSPRADELLALPAAAPARPGLARRLLELGDRLLHALLMSPTAR